MACRTAASRIVGIRAAGPKALRQLAGATPKTSSSSSTRSGAPLSPISREGRRRFEGGRVTNSARARAVVLTTTSGRRWAPSADQRLPSKDRSKEPSGSSNSNRHAQRREGLGLTSFSATSRPAMRCSGCAASSAPSGCRSYLRPQAISASRTGARSRPLSVSSYQTSRRPARWSRFKIPASSSCRSRIVSHFGVTFVSRRRRSLKRRGPVRRSRTIRSDQRSPIVSRLRAARQK